MKFLNNCDAITSFKFPTLQASVVFKKTCGVGAGEEVEGLT